MKSNLVVMTMLSFVCINVFANKKIVVKVYNCNSSCTELLTSPGVELAVISKSKVITATMSDVNGDAVLSLPENLDQNSQVKFKFSGRVSKSKSISELTKNPIIVMENSKAVKSNQDIDQAIISRDVDMTSKLIKNIEIELNNKTFLMNSDGTLNCTKAKLSSALGVFCARYNLISDLNVKLFNLMSVLKD